MMINAYSDPGLSNPDHMMKHTCLQGRETIVHDLFYDHTVLTCFECE